jgi:UDP:flavonoid glycosyltransferase YjiC (YdhE family)
MIPDPFSLPAIEALLGALKDRGVASVVFIDGLSDELAARFACETLRFTRERVDLALAARACDVAILNGAHASSIAMLLAGKPTLQIPLFLEHTLNARAVARLGAGLVAGKGDGQQVVERLGSLLEDLPRYTGAARRFAERYVTVFDAERQRGAMIRAAAGVLAGAAGVA